MDMHTALLLTTLAGLSTGLGGLVVWMVRAPGPRVMAFSQGFAAGVMMTVSLSEMLPSAVEAYANAGAVPVGAALRCASLCAAGMLVAWLLEKSLPGEEALARRLSVPSKTRAAALRGALATMAAIVLHNLPEGMVAGLAAALALTGEPDAISGALALSLGIGLQNIPEGAAVSLPLAHNGRTRSQAFFAGAASGLVEPLGALLAFALAEWVSTALPWLLSAAAGCMVCVTAQEMIPQAVEGDEPVGVVSIVLGFALMMALDVAL